MGLRPKVHVLLLLLTSVIARPSAGNPQMHSEHRTGILSLPHGPAAAHTADVLQKIGLRAQPLRRLPFALVSGPSAAIDEALRSGLGTRFDDTYQIPFASRTTNRWLRSDLVHSQLGVTGAGQTIAIVDTGINATHPALRNRVTHNLRIVAPETVKAPSGSFEPMFVAMDEGPYSDTDDIGHGTQVAGSAAADGTDFPNLVGAAPGAELIGYGANSVTIGIDAALVAYDHILDHPDWGVDVVNNSFAGPFMYMYDETDPFTVAIETMADAGIAMVFGAGNSGNDGQEMTIDMSRPSPSVFISGATANGGNDLAGFSANGPRFDNSTLTATDGQHVRYEGDRLGIFHPTVLTPGEEIDTTCEGPPWCVHNDVTYGAAGTSHSTPHLSGLLALLKEANPDLTVEQMRKIVEATARPPARATPFSRAGFGIADAYAAVQLARHPDHAAEIEARHQDALARVLAARDHSVVATEYWSWDPPFTGVDDHRMLEVEVPSATDLAHFIVGWGESPAPYRLTIRDARGTLVGVSQVEEGDESISWASEVYRSSLELDLRGLDVELGTWTIEVTGGPFVASTPQRWARTTVYAGLAEAIEAPAASG